VCFNTDEWEKAQQQEAQMELTRREMARYSRDLIRVYNPLDVPFRFTWDSYPQVIPAKGHKDIERYLAREYLHKMSEKLIGEQMLKAGEELKALREKQLGKTFLDKYEENKEVWDRVPRLNDEKLIAEHAKVLIVGLVEEYGMEDVIEQEQIVEKKDSPYDEAYKRMDRKILDDDIIDERPVKELV